MKLSYRSAPTNENVFLTALKIVIFSLLLCACCLPSFGSIGHFAFQITTAAVLSFICTAVLFLILKGSVKVIANALTAFLMIMLAVAFFQQLDAQLSSGNPFTAGWIYTFYYDRPLTVAVVWAASFISVTLLRLFTPYNDDFSDFRSDFSYFLKNSSKGFLVFYIFVLVYCFILQRTPQTQSGLNLIPFNMIMTYINGTTSTYESLFYFTGNFICFFPFGFLFKVYKKNKDILKTILLPFILSLLIEASQLLLKNGNFDVDDIILNTLGFYFGVGICFAFDKVRESVTNGLEKTIFY